jgi:hypothetical protein
MVRTRARGDRAELQPNWSFDMDAQLQPLLAVASALCVGQVQR